MPGISGASVQETGKRPTASLDRNLVYLSLVETLFGYPLDGVVLTIGCDKTTPALFMAAATVDIPAPHRKRAQIAYESGLRIVDMVHEDIKPTDIMTENAFRNAIVVNMRPPAYLLKMGGESLPCIGDGRQSGTSGSPSILNAAPEAAAMGGLALLKTGDRVRVDLAKDQVNALVDAGEWAQRHADLVAAGGFVVPEHQTPWQKMYRESVTQFDEGMVIKGASDFRSVASKHIPRNNH